MHADLLYDISRFWDHGIPHFGGSEKEVLLPCTSSERSFTALFNALERGAYPLFPAPERGKKEVYGNKKTGRKEVIGVLQFLPFLISPRMIGMVCNLVW